MSVQRKTILTIGESMALLSPDEPVEISNQAKFTLDFGGAESNFSIALSRLGHQVRYLTKFGKDPFGKMISSILQKEGVEVIGGTDDKQPTAVFFKEWLTDGSRRVYYYRRNSAASTISPSDLQQEYFDNVALLHVGGITPALSKSCHEAISDAIRIANERKITVSFDPNFRSALWQNKEEARSILEPLIKQANFVFMGDDDARGIFGNYEPDALVETLRSPNTQFMIFKEGAAGARCWSPNEGFLRQEPRILGPAIDPVGAGDGFAAGFISGWLRGWDLRKMLMAGAFVGGVCVTRVGDYGAYPMERELLDSV